MEAVVFVVPFLLVLGWIAKAAIGDYRERQIPSCPWCGARLKRILVVDLERPPPPGSVWYCKANHSIHESFNRPWTCYFADRPAAKPAPSEEV
jgi:hypothetical protein